MKKKIGKVFRKIKKAPKKTAKWVKSKIFHKKKKHGLEFTAITNANLGADENVWHTDDGNEESMDIPADIYEPDSNFAIISEVVCMFRGSASY